MRTAARRPSSSSLVTSPLGPPRGSAPATIDRRPPATPGVFRLSLRSECRGATFRGLASPFGGGRPGRRWYHPPDCESRLPPDGPAPSGHRSRSHARPVDDPSHDSGRSSRPAATRETTMSATASRTADASATAEPRRGHALGRHRPGQPVDRPSCTRTRSGRGRASSPRRGRSSSGPASTPVARPQDKFIVREPRAPSKIWWGEVNRPDRRGALRPAAGPPAGLRRGRGPLRPGPASSARHPAHRRSLRVYTETAWASIFARNLFRRPSARDLAAFVPNFTIIDVPSFKADPATEGTRTETAILAPPRAGWRSSSSAPSTPARSRRAPSRS